MKIAFVDFHPIGYTCDTPSGFPLGGTQSAVAYLSAALARRGHDVIVINGVQAPVSAEAVRFVGKDCLTSVFLNQFDAVVVVSIALGRELRAAGIARPLLLWCHHDANQPAVQNLLSPQERAAWNGFAMITRWQAEHYARAMAISPAEQCVLGNAISPFFHDLPESPRWFVRGDAPVLYYTSTPFRGLEVLLAAMPALRAAVPGIRLRVFSGMRLYGVAPRDDEFAWLYDRCRATDGVEYIGPLPQKLLAAAMATADVLAYPCTFPETACIAAMEAMAAGSMIVSTRLGALEETTAGFAFLMEPTSDKSLLADKYADFLTRRIKQVLEPSSLIVPRLTGQRQFARENYNWERRAEEWERWLLSGLAGAEWRRQAAVPETALSAKAAGNILKTAGELKGAIALYRRSLEIEPDYAPALYNLGLVFHETEQFDEAEACFRRVAALDPRDAEALFHLGVLLQRRMRLDEAADTFRLALRHAPDNPHLWMRLGDVGIARLTGRSLREAAECFRKALELQPGLADAHFALGNVHRFDGRHDEALRSFQEALRLEPTSAAFGAGLLNEMQQLCDWSRLDDLSEFLRRSAIERPEQALHPFSLLSIPSTPKEQLACAKNFSRLLAGTMAAERTRLGFRFDRPPRGRLRIGYLSAEFHAHATAYLAAELFELHDRGRFEVLAYSYGPDDGSPIRARLRRGFDRFVDLGSRSHAEAAAAIRADGVDILVDLKGYTMHARPEIMALRPAPVQVNFLGYPGTMGAEFIDYIVGDRFVTPAGEAGHFSESLAILPDCYQVNDRRRQVAETPPRRKLGLPDGAFVFCCFNQTYKILPEFFAAWMRMLQGVPGSVLWLLEWNPFVAQNLRREATARGVDPARLIFAPSLPLAEHLGRLPAADLFLDTLPVNAHTTASDALWAGLPLLTCTGETFVSRVAESLLTAVGLPELVTRGVADYEALGLRLARAPEELLALRNKLSVNRKTAPLFDTPRFVRNLETAYEAMWRIHAAGGAPRLIEF
jgi:predicted O-linked N-acetylglucosamine transferase (SPINDLY family)/glycosyltransferase involved in cell wall biosynthesis